MVLQYMMVRSDTPWRDLHKRDRATNHHRRGPQGCMALRRWSKDGAGHLTATHCQLTRQISHSLTQQTAEMEHLSHILAVEACTPRFSAIVAQAPAVCWRSERCFSFSSCHIADSPCCRGARALPRLRRRGVASAHRPTLLDFLSACLTRAAIGQRVHAQQHHSGIRH